MNKIKIGIAGCLGRMGSELVKETLRNPETEFVGGFENPSNINLGKSIGKILGFKTDIILIEDPKKIFDKSQVVIDFTTPESSFINLEIASEFKVPLVIGTTGFGDKSKNLIKESSSKIPIVYSENMSVGVNVLINLINSASKIFKAKEYDVEISERHHRYKVDAPSGTAIALGKVVAEARNDNFNDKKIYNRTSIKEGRKDGDIGFAVTRAGDIAGDHTVSFIGNNDEIQLIHKAKNRIIFVIGAIKAAIWIIGKKPGIYSMKNVLGF